jgi:cobalt/nickel transport system permease protein
MHGLAIDDAAWSSRWRDRSLPDKTILSLGLTGTALLLPPWPGSVLVALVALTATVGPAGTPWRLVARAMGAPLLFIAIGSLSVAVTVTAPPDVALAVTAASLDRAAGVGAHAVAGSLSVLLLALTTPMVDLLSGLRALKVPAACVEVAALTYRMLFILLDCVHAVRESQAARLGYSSPRRSMTSAAALTAAVLTRSWEHARRLEEGLAGRGYTTELRTLQDDRPGSPAFRAATLSVLAAVVAVSLGVGMVSS